MPTSNGNERVSVHSEEALPPRDAGRRAASSGAITLDECGAKLAVGEA